MMVPLGVHFERSGSTMWAATVRVSPRFLLGAAVFLVALGFFVWNTPPPDPNYCAPGWHPEALNADNVKVAFRRLVHAFLPLRPFDDPNYWTDWEHFWNQHLALTLGVGIGLLASIIVPLLPGWFEIGGLVAGYVLMATFTIVRYGVEMRHLGNFFLLFIAASWVHRVKAPRRNHIVSTVLLFICAGFQIQSFAAAATADWKYSFSGGRDMAASIEDHHLQDLQIVAGPDALVLTVTSYLNRPFISSQTEEINVTQVFHSRRRRSRPRRWWSAPRGRCAPITSRCWSSPAARCRIRPEVSSSSSSRERTAAGRENSISTGCRSDKLVCRRNRHSGPLSRRAFGSPTSPRFAGRGEGQRKTRAGLEPAGGEQRHQAPGRAPRGR